MYKIKSKESIYNDILKLSVKVFMAHSFSPTRITQGPKCCSQLGLPLTKYHLLGGLNNRNVFVHNSGAWESKIKVSAWQGPGGALFLAR